MPLLPEYIEARIRRPAPSNSAVVPGSTPVVSFGDAQRATVATLGLNPSRVEFLDRNGHELTGDSRRLATHSSLGTTDLKIAPTSTIAKVLEDCNAYFQRNPYRRWFDQLSPVLKSCGVSYEEGSACHLDLVQWATDPTWAKLTAENVRDQLLKEDAHFLEKQLQNENLKFALVNGMSVICQLQKTIVDDLKEVDRIIGHAYQDTGIFVGSVFGLQIVGWSTNLQSSFGVTTKLKEELAKRVAALTR
jgi:hypothetical protein